MSLWQCIAIGMPISEDNLINHFYFIFGSPSGLGNMPKLAYKAAALEAALEDIRNGMSKKAAA